MVKRMIFCCGRVQKKGKRKRELRDSLIKGVKPRIGFDTYEIDSPSIYDTITLDSTYTIDKLTDKPKKKKIYIQLPAPAPAPAPAVPEPKGGEGELL
jgi:hypothetical protein